MSGERCAPPGWDRQSWEIVDAWRSIWWGWAWQAGGEAAAERALAQHRRYCRAAEEGEPC